MGKCAGGVAHTVYTNRGRKLGEVCNMLLLMRFDMVPADGDGKGFLDCLNFANNIAVSTHDVLDGEGGTVVESV